MTVHGRGSNPGFPDKWHPPLPTLDLKKMRRAREARTKKDRGPQDTKPDEAKPDETPEPDKAEPDAGAATQPLQHHDMPTQAWGPPTQPLQRHDMPTQPLQRRDMPTGALHFRDYPTVTLPKDPRDETPTQVLPRVGDTLEMPKVGKGMPNTFLFPAGGGQAPRTASANQANARRRAQPIQVPGSDVPNRTQPGTRSRGLGPLFPEGQTYQPQDPKELQPDVQGLDKRPGRVKEAAKTIGKETAKGAVQGAVLGAMVPVAGETGVSEAGGAAAGAAKGLAVGVARAAGRGAAKGAAKGAIKGMGPLFPEGQAPAPTKSSGLSNEAHKTQTETEDSKDVGDPRKFR